MWKENKKKKNQLNQIKNMMKCPRCQAEFPENFSIHELANHIRNCFQGGNSGGIQNNLKKVEQKETGFQYEKVPKDYTLTTFKWEKKPTKQLNSQILGKTEEEVHKLSFQEKEFWFRDKVERFRIPWQNGADYMRLDKANILMTSLLETEKVNMHREVKIQFLGDKVNDAGGLLRQWIHMVIKQIFDFSTGIFSFANTEDIMYKLKWDSDLDEQFSGQLLILFGIIIGKSIFERTPLMCYLDRTILRQICESSVKIEDIYGFDKDLYKTWNFILESEELEDLQTYFVVNKDTGHTIEEIQLVEGGKNTLVTNENKFLYVDMCIQTMTTDMVSRSIGFIKEGINRVVPTKCLSIFQPHEMEMLLYGIPFIDVQDWKTHTEYKAPLSPNHKVIEWFWKTVEGFDQEQLANFLHFCTGSSRTPIHGFKKLESNRGNFSKFLIEGNNFKKENPYPKGHTCFNRLELPIYPDEETLKLYVVAISKNTLDGIFGLD